MLNIYTAQYRYPGPHRLDITIKENDPIGKIFAPTWDMVMGHKKTGNDQEYINKYHKMILDSLTYNKPAWDELLGREYVVLVCFCTVGNFCHRHLLADYLSQLGGKKCGEITNFTKWSK